MAATLPDLTIRQLEYLVAVADEPTWATAAERVGVSPSALSQGLAELERRLGVPLFESAGRRRVLRDSAEPVLEHARRVLAQTADLVSWSQGVRAAQRGRVRVGMIDVAAVVHFTGVVAAFRAERPDVVMTLTVAPSADLLRGVRDGSLDLAVCVAPAAPPPGLSVVELLREPLVVMAPPGTTIGVPSTWGPWVTFPAGSHTRALILGALARLGAPVTIAAESHQPDVLRQMVQLGLGWTVLPLSGSGAPAAARAGVVDGPPLVERALVLVRRADTIHDPAADELAAWLVRAASARSSERSSPAMSRTSGRRRPRVEGGRRAGTRTKEA
ncbi:MAG: LysR family transcriptional regulator [Ilumatobacteraceae bacterium]